MITILFCFAVAIVLLASAGLLRLVLRILGSEPLWRAITAVLLFPFTLFGVFASFMARREEMREARRRAARHE